MIGRARSVAIGIAAAACAISTCGKTERPSRAEREISTLAKFRSLDSATCDLQRASHSDEIKAISFADLYLCFSEAEFIKLDRVDRELLLSDNPMDAQTIRLPALNATLSGDYKNSFLKKSCNSTHNFLTEARELIALQPYTVQQNAKREFVLLDPPDRDRIFHLYCSECANGEDFLFSLSRSSVDFLESHYQLSPCTKLTATVSPGIAIETTAANTMNSMLEFARKHFVLRAADD